MANRTILKFSTDEETFEVIDNDGRPVDPLDLSETLESVNEQLGFELYKTDVNDKTADGEELTVVAVTENDSGAVTETLIEEGNNVFAATLAEKGWFMEEADNKIIDELDDSEEEDWDDYDDDDYQSVPEDFEDDE